MEDESPIKFTVRKNNSYLCIKTEKLKFLDITSYLAPGYSYDQFLKAYECSARKSFLPYEWFDDADKLNYPHLPPYDSFYSSLQNGNILEEEFSQFQCLLSQGNSESKALEVMNISEKPKTGLENYQQLEQSWKDNNMSSFRDFLVWYNNLDVKPFIEALEKLTEFYRSKGLDTFKDGISVPGLASRYLFSKAG